MYKNRDISASQKIDPSLHKRVARFVWRGGQGLVRREGALFLLNLRYTVDRFILLSGVDEPTQRAFFFDNVRQRACDTFIDVGANIGTYSVFAALKSTCKTIIAFEPNPRCYDKLRTNLLLNDLTDRVITHMAAVSDQKGTVPFLVSPDDNDLFSKVANDGNASRDVPAVRLDDELPLTGQRIALKIDIEGHELAALEGMKNLLRNNECFLQIECWQQNAARVNAVMKAEGYDFIHRIDEDYYFVRQE